MTPNRVFHAFGKVSLFEFFEDEDGDFFLSVVVFVVVFVLDVELVVEEGLVGEEIGGSDTRGGLVSPKKLLFF